MNYDGLRRMAAWPLLIATACVSLLAGCQDRSGPSLVAAPDANELEVAKKPPPPPPPNPEIACHVGDQIFVLDADGSNKTRVIDTNEQGVPSPSWSPDGSALTYATFQSGIWTINVDGTGNQLLVSWVELGYRCYRPVWSPTGDEIAFLAYQGDGIWGVYVVPAGGGEPTTLYVTTHRESSAELGWNHDGTRLVLGNGDDLIIIDRATGTGEQVLTDFATVTQGIDWGRQGVDTILFSTMDDEIYTLDISLPGQMPEYVTAGNSPSFSPDNSKFVFNYGGAGGELKIYTFATGEIVGLRRSPPQHPDWRR